MAKRLQAKKGIRQKKPNHEIRDRVISVLRHSMLHKSMIVLMVAVGGALVWQHFSKVEVLVIESVQIEGEFNYLSAQDLKERALPHVQGGFFSVDLQSIREVLIDLPWVENISIRRQWPDKLSVRVIEKQPVAFWGEDGLLSSRAILFKPEKININLKLPHITGPDGQHEFMLKELGRMQAWLTGTELMITKIKQDARRSWTLYLSSVKQKASEAPKLELRLGRENQHERLHRFTEIYKQRLKKQKQKIRHIDMRYTNGFAVAWQNREA
jgi:cell division protein FtsQ